MTTRIKYILFLVLVFSPAINRLFAQCQPDWNWCSTGLGIPGHESVTGIAADPWGNTVVAGNFNSGSLKFGPFTLYQGDAVSGYVVKYDPSGNVIWAKRVAYGLHFSLKNVTTDIKGNIYVVGYYDYQVLNFGTFQLTNKPLYIQSGYLVKLSPEGVPLWGKSQLSNCNNGQAWTQQVAVDKDCNVAVAGMWTMDTLKLDSINLLHNVSATAQFDDIFLALYDSMGKIKWVHKARTSSILGNKSYNVSFDNKNNVYWTGMYRNTIILGFDTLKYRKNVFWAKIRPDGQFAWAKTSYNSSAGTEGVNILYLQPYDENNVFGGWYGGVLGRVYFDSISVKSSSLDWGFVMNFDSNGKTRWIKPFYGQGHGYSVQVTGIALDKAGNIYVTGDTGADSMNFDGQWIKRYPVSAINPYVAKFNSKGKFIWGKMTDIRTTEAMNCEGIAVDPAGRVTIAGEVNDLYAIFGKDTIRKDTIHGNEADPFTASIFNPVCAGRDIRPPSCHGSMDGSIEIIPLGGNPPYTYSWAGGQHTKILNGLGAGTYIYTVTDSTMCTFTDTAEVIDPGPLKLAVSVKDDHDNGHTGEATVSVTGGTPPYHYLWNDPLSQTTTKASGLSSGNYKVTVTDKNGCTRDTTITVNNTVSVEENNPFGIRIYPNPVTEKRFFVEMKTATGDAVKVIIYDNSGAAVYDKSYLPVRERLKEKINLDKCQSGIYHVRIHAGCNIFIKDFILQ